MTSDGEAGTPESQDFVHDTAITAIAILGSTGSVGKSALDVVARHPDRYRVQALSAHSRVDKLFEQCRRFKPRTSLP